MQLSNVIIKPYLTEKSYAGQTQTLKKYAFIVSIKANKSIIALAFKNIFNINPVKVSTMIRKSVVTKTGTLHPGFSKTFKIAYITLPKGKDIAISQEDLEAKAKNVSSTKTNKNEKAKEISPASLVKDKTAKKPSIVSSNEKVKTEDKKTGWQKSTNKNY